MSITCKTIVATLGVTAALATGYASAEPVLRDLTVNATGICQSALPVFETAIRKRPTAIRNEGTTPAFVSCSLPGDFFNEGNVFVGVGLTNLGTAPVTVECTFVDGFALPWAGGPTFNTGSVTLPAGGTNAIIWEPADGETFSNNANLSCALPVGVEIQLVEIQYEEDNGVEPPK